MTIIQQLRENVQEIELIKTQNHILISQFMSSDDFLDLLNETKLNAEPIETHLIDNTIRIKYKYKQLAFYIILTDKEIADPQIETLFKEKVSDKIKEIDTSLKNIENTARLIMEKFDNDKK